MRVLLVDYSFLYYRCKFAYSSIVREISGVPYMVGAGFGFLRHLRIFDDIYDKVYICLDGAPRKCLEQQSTYKGDRLSKVDVFELSMGDVVELTQLKTSKFEVWWHPEMEADETIAFLAKGPLLGKVDCIDIFTTDFDLYQLVWDLGGISVVNAFNAKLRDYKRLKECDVKNRWGVYPSSIPMFKAIKGDKSDNILGVYRFPTKLAIELAEKYSSPDELYSFLGEQDESFFKYPPYQRLLQAEKQVYQNYLMVYLNPHCIPYVYSYRKSLSDVRDWAEHYGLHV